GYATCPVRVLSPVSRRSLGRAAMDGKNSLGADARRGRGQSAVWRWKRWRLVHIRADLQSVRTTICDGVHGPSVRTKVARVERAAPKDSPLLPKRFPACWPVAGQYECASRRLLASSSA